MYLPFISRWRHQELLAEAVAQEAIADEAYRIQSLATSRAVIAELQKRNNIAAAAIASYAKTISAQDDTVRLHLARIEFLQRSLIDATTTTEDWALDRKEALDRIAELEQALGAAEGALEFFRVNGVTFPSGDNS